MLYLLSSLSTAPLVAFIATIGFGFFCGPFFMRLARRFFACPSREFTPEGHKAKNGVPTMGGLYILGLFMAVAILFCDLFNPLVWLMLCCLLGFGLIGFIDDWSKIHKTGGMSARTKFIAQWSIAAGVVIAWIMIMKPSTALSFAGYSYDLGWLFILWAMFIIVATSNAVNLTDGLDGLAATCLIGNFATFSVIAASLYPDLSIIAAILVGALVCFFWFNAHPASLFMGDVGSLSLGAGLAFCALAARQELLLSLTGCIFVAETVSVMLQVFWYKRTKIRIFKMAPIHHHFELSGWSEVQIMVRAGIITGLMCVIALVVL